MFRYTVISLLQTSGIFIIEGFNTFRHLKCLFYFPGTLLQVIIDKPKGGRGRLGSFSSSFKESKKEIVRQCFLFTNHLLLTTRASNGRLHLAKVSVRTSMDCNVSKWLGHCRYGQTVYWRDTFDVSDAGNFLTVKCKHTRGRVRKALKWYCPFTHKRCRPCKDHIFKGQCILWFDRTKNDRID